MANRRVCDDRAIEKGELQKQFELETGENIDKCAEIWDLVEYWEGYVVWLEAYIGKNVKK